MPSKYHLPGILVLILLLSLVSDLREIRSDHRDRYQPHMVTVGFFWKDGRDPDTLAPKGNLVLTFEGETLTIWQFKTTADAKAAAILVSEDLARNNPSTRTFAHIHGLPDGIAGYTVTIKMNRKPIRSSILEGRDPKMQ